MPGYGLSRQGAYPAHGHASQDVRGKMDVQVHSGERNDRRQDQDAVRPCSTTA